MQAQVAKFSIGQLITHKLFDYRGVIIDVDANFQGTDEWYEQVALSRPPKNQPWYQVLVHNESLETYVAERNLLADDSNEAVVHPLLNNYFDSLEGGVYRKLQANN